MGRADNREIQIVAKEDSQWGYWLTGLVVGAVGGLHWPPYAPKSGTELCGMVAPAKCA
jgi:hypothetical protein